MTINLHRVDDRLWRSGQPLADEWRPLHDLTGIRRVVKLNEPGMGDYAMAERLGIEIVRIHISDADAQSVLPDASVLDRIDVALDAGPARVLVHCTEGKDRAGIAVARYRVRRCGWTKQKAWDEWVAMGSHGYKGLVAAWEAWRP